MYLEVLRAFITLESNGCLRYLYAYCFTCYNHTIGCPLTELQPPSYLDHLQNLLTY